MAPCVLAACVLGAPGNFPGTQGAYKVTCHGAFIGDGNAAVAAKSVTLTLHLQEVATGASGNLVAPNLTVTAGSFSGTASWGGLSVTVFGHIDPPDGEVVKSSRIMANLAFSNGTHARVVGLRAPAGDPPKDD